MGGHPLMGLVLAHYDFFATRLWSDNQPVPEIPMFLSTNAFMLWTSAVRIAMSGHEMAVYPLLRTALESACYVLLVKRRPELAEVWSNREKRSERAQSLPSGVRLCGPRHSQTIGRGGARPRRIRRRTLRVQHRCRRSSEFDRCHGERASRTARRHADPLRSGEPVSGKFHAGLSCADGDDQFRPRCLDGAGALLARAVDERRRSFARTAGATSGTIPRWQWRVGSRWHIVQLRCNFREVRRCPFPLLHSFGERSTEDAIGISTVLHLTSNG